MTMINLNSKELAPLEQVLAKTEDVRRLKRAQALIWLAEGIALMKSPAPCECRTRLSITGWRALNLGVKSPPSYGSLMARAKDDHARRRRLIDPLIDEVIDQDQRALFEDRGASHTAEESLEAAADLGIELHFFPRVTPKLNAMDRLWRFVKGQALADHPTRSVDESADAACQYLLAMRPKECLKKAGVLSSNFD